MYIANGVTRRHCSVNSSGSGSGSGSVLLPLHRQYLYLISVNFLDEFTPGYVVEFASGFSIGFAISSGFTVGFAAISSVRRSTGSSLFEVFSDLLPLYIFLFYLCFPLMPHFCWHGFYLYLYLSPVHHLSQELLTCLWLFDCPGCLNFSVFIYFLSITYLPRTFPGWCFFALTLLRRNGIMACQVVRSSPS